MDKADFVHLVRLSEQASAADSGRYRRGVALFAALGYGWVLGCLLLSLGAVAWLAGAILRSGFRGWYLWIGISALGLLWSSLRALWCRFEPPEGWRLAAGDARELFDAIERIRRKVKGPALDGVYLRSDLNACIAQRPRWGLFGGARNELGIGLPLLMAVDRQRLLAVLAHEYGHLRGEHGRFAAWIYRTRASWTRLHEELAGDGVAARITRGFLDWYFPRFVARTFALARQDEYEADRIAGKLLGPEVAGAALVEIAVKTEWLAARFWRRHWAQAAREPLPVGPFRAMRAELALAPPADFAAAALRDALRQPSGLDDTHPGLRDRLEALDAGAALPAWSRRAALDWLGAQADAWIARADRQWCSENASAWKRHHAFLQRLRARVDELAARGPKDAAAWTELADLRRRLDPDADVRDHYERALVSSPGHPAALRGLAELTPEQPAPAWMAVFERLHQESPAHRWWASRRVVARLEADSAHDAQLLKQWRERARAAEAAEERAWEELNTAPWLANTGPHDLGDFERDDLRRELAACEPLARAWLLRKHLREFPGRRAYLLFVRFEGLDAEDAEGQVAQLQRSLDLPGPVRVLPVELVREADVQRQAGGAIHPA